MMFTNDISGSSGHGRERSDQPASPIPSRLEVPEGGSSRQRPATLEGERPATLEGDRRVGPLLLVLDLESLARTKREETTTLAERLRNRPNTSVLYAAPKRSLTSANACVDALQMPTADVLVADQGASVGALQHDPRLDDLNAELGESWPGAYEIRTRMTDLGHLLGEHRWKDARRMSYFPLRDVPLDEAQSAIKEALADLEVEVVTDEQEQIDVIPKDTDTTSTIVRTIDALEMDPGCVVVSGRFLERRIFDERGYWGIATGDTPRHLRAALVHNLRIHLTSAPGAAGVLDGLHTLEFL